MFNLIVGCLCGGTELVSIKFATFEWLWTVERIKNIFLYLLSKNHHDCFSSEKCTKNHDWNKWQNIFQINRNTLPLLSKWIIYNIKYVNPNKFVKGYSFVYLYKGLSKVKWKDD